MHIWRSTRLADTIPVAAPPLSKEEIEAMEAEATFTVQRVIATSVMLYLCRSPLSTGSTPPNAHATAPFVVDAVKKMF